MSKRIMAMLMAFVLVLGCLPTAVLAEEAPAQHTCEHCGQVPEWVDWDGTGAMEDGKHYKLTAETLTLSAPIALSSGSYVLCLNGNTISAATSKRIFDLSGTANLVIVDHTAAGEGESYTAGKLTGATNSAVAIAGNASFTMYDGVMEGNNRPSGQDGGCIRVAGDGAVNLLGGLYRNNYARYGGVIYAEGSGTDAEQVRLENVYITGNSSSHTGAIHVQNKVNVAIKDSTLTGNTTAGTLTGAIYLQSAGCQITLSGKVIIDGNTNRMQEANILNRNMILNNAATKLNLDGLAEGSRIQLKAKSTDPKTAITTTENQKAWNCGWITLGNDSVSWTDANADGIVQASELVAGHYHDGVAYTAVTGATALPKTAGNYYLTQDVTLASVHAVGENMNLCLNGHNITTSGTGRILQTTKNSGATLVLEDCTAYTDGQGNYIAGAITGCNMTSAGTVYINAGTTVKMYSGKISGNTASAAAGVYINGGSFHLYGGEISDNKATAGSSGRHGGGVYNSGTFVMEGGVICNNEAGNYGGGIYSNKAATITGGEIYGNKAVQGGGVALYKKTFTVSNVKIHSNTATTEGGGLWAASNSTVTLKDTVITENTAPSGGGLVVRASKVTLESGQISKNTVTGEGGGVMVTDQAAEFTMTGGKISENSAKFGGGVLIMASGTNTVKGKMTLKGGTIEKNTATAQGGGVYASTDTSFCMEGGTITGNSAKRLGGGIYLLISTGTITGGTIENNISEEDGGGIALSVNGDPVLNLQGGTVTGNTAPNSGGIHTNESSILNISGNPKVIGNNAGGKASNLKLAGDALLMNVGTMTEGAQVSVTGVPFRAISKPVSTDCSASFGSDSSLYSVKYVNGALYLDVAVAHNHCACGGAATGCDHTQLKFAPWESATTLPETGAYYLLNDVQLTDYDTVSDDLILCLNGHDIIAADGKRTLNLAKNSGATLTIVDCTAHTNEKGEYICGAITGGNQQSAGAIYLNGGTTLKLYSGKISGNTANAGAGIYSAGTVYMYGGEISNNKAVNATSNRHGGGVMINGANAAFHMAGGTIKGNEAAQYGGGVFITGGAKATFTGGKLLDNKAERGGGLALYKNAFEVGAVTISGNTAEEGGGLYVASGADVTLKDAAITGNSAASGAGVSVREAKAKLVSGEISGNTADGGSGGGMYAVGEGAQITVQGGKISGNTAKFGGGVLTLTNAQLTLKDGSIEKNTTTAQGGGVYVSTGTQFCMEGGKIAGNTAKRLGGGVYNLNSTSNISGGIIENNTSDEGGGAMGTTAGTLILEGVVVRNNQSGKHGGALYLVNSTTKKDGQTVSRPATAQLLKGTEISGNAAEKSACGGGIFVSGEGSQVVIDGAVITKNTAKYGGGAICQTKSSITVKSGAITQNTSSSNGGGLYVSTGTTLNLEGGEISKNTSKLNGGGIYFLTSNLKMSGGKISGNTAKTDGGGFYMQLGNSDISGGSITGNSAKNAGGVRMTGGKHRISGLSVSYNTATTDAGGMQIGRQRVKENGVNVDKMPDFVVSSITMVGNKSKNGGALLLLSKGAEYTIYNAYIANNEATNGGGAIYVSTGTTLNLYNSTLTKNYGKTGGAVQHLSSAGYYENVEISENTGNNAAAMNVTKNAETKGVHMKNVKILNNVGQASGAMVVQGTDSYFTGDGLEFTGNSTPKTGGAIFVTTKAKAEIKNTVFKDNSAGEDAGAVMLGLNTVLDMDNCEYIGNQAGRNGGGIYNRGLMRINNAKVLNNTCGNNGAGIGSGKTGSTHTGDKCGLYLTNVICSGNKADGNGGGLFGSLGCHVVAKDLILNDNTATKGAAAWVQEDFIVENLEATGNTASEHAVYLAASHYDGQSYFCGVMKFSGKIVVRDNKGGGVYVGEQTTLTLEGDSLADGSYMDVALHSGLLTQKVFGVYDYEGSDLNYVITVGQRSVTDPEHLLKSGETAGEQGGDANVLLYVGVGVFTLAIAAVAVILVAMKKKKTANATKE